MTSFFRTILWSYDRWKTRMLNVFLSNTSRNSWYSEDNTFFITMSDLLCFSRCFSTSFRMTKNRLTFFLLFIILNDDASIIAMFITKTDFFSFELEISSSLRFESEISNRLRVFEFIDELRWFFVFSRKTNRFWSIWTSFRKRTFVMIVKNFFEFCFVEFLVKMSNLTWFDWFEKDFFSKWMFFFFVCHFYSSRMRAKFRRKLDDVRFLMIADFVFTHSWFI
jgi:hypothetical protein